MNFAYFAKLDRSIVLKINVSLTIKKTRNYCQFIAIKDIKSKIKSNELTHCIYIYMYLILLIYSERLNVENTYQLIQLD